jgi:hypothetical protein
MFTRNPTRQFSEYPAPRNHSTHLPSEYLLVFLTEVRNVAYLYTKEVRICTGASQHLNIKALY